MFRKMFRAARLDPRLYEEVRDDPVAALQAVAIIILMAISLALPLTFSGASQYVAGSDESVKLSAVNVFVWSFLYVFVSWLIFSLLGYLPGRYLVGRDLTFGSLLRVMGFANVPGIFYLLIGLGGFMALLINTVLLLWLLACVIMAFHQTLKVSFLATFPMSVAGMFITIGVRNYLFGVLLT